MISWIVFIASLAFAFLALRGWPVDGVAWLRGLCAFGFMMMGVGAMILLPNASGSRRFKATGKPRGRDRLTAALGVAVLCGCLYAALVFAPPAASQFSQHVVMLVQERLGGSNGDDADADDSDLQGEGQDDSYEVGAMFDPNGAVVPKSADLNPSSDPAISLKVSGSVAAEKLRRSGRIYLHLFSHHVFDGERWTSHAGDGPLYLSCDSSGVVHLAKSDEAPDHVYTIHHHDLSSGLDALTTLQGARYVKLPEITQLNQGTWLLPPPDNPLGIIAPYEAASSPRCFENLLASGTPIVAGEQGPAHLAPARDESLNRKIRELAVTFRSHPTLDQQVAALQDWLSKSFTYTLQMDYPDKDQSALESFLDNPGSGEGFCVHFASVAALILRELGVPSRVSYGWTGGEFYPQHNQFVFRAEDGHAWAEMYLEGQGWVVFETTPSSGLPPTYSSVPGTAPPEIERYDDEEKTAASDQPKIIPSWVWMLLLMGGGAAILFVLAKRRQFAEEGAVFDAGAAAPPGYLQLFYRTCARMGHPKPAGSTLQQYLDQLDDESLAIPFANELLTYHYKVAYRKASRDPDVEKQFRRQIKAL